jgi:membrane-associated phospholipid phosphatase
MDLSLGARRTSPHARPPRSVQLPWRTGHVSWRGIAFVVLLIAYVLVTFGVTFHSPLMRVDNYLQELSIRHSHHAWVRPLNDYAMLGQRAPSTLVALPWFLWRTWRQRSPRPLILLGTALLALNLSVGVVKLAVGRLGPLRTQHAHDVFVGGNIYPSGHVSNTVVLYGMIAWIAVKHRRVLVGAVVFLATSIGMATIFLNTHWFSDVLGGWLAGALVLLALPTLMPYAERGVDAVVRGVLGLWHRVRDWADEMPEAPPSVLKSPVRAHATTKPAAKPAAKSAAKSAAVPAAVRDGEPSAEPVAEPVAAPAVDQGNETPVSSSAGAKRPVAAA